MVACNSIQTSRSVAAICPNAISNKFPSYSIPYSLIFQGFSKEIRIFYSFHGGIPDASDAGGCVCAMVLGKTDVFGTVIFSALELGYAAAEQTGALGVVSLISYD